MVLKSHAVEPEPDPVVYLEGGPGLPALGLSPDRLDRFAPFLERRDVILLDQRGVGFSEPKLDCLELFESQLTVFQQADAEVLVDGQVAALRTCHERLVAEGHDLVRALGYEHVNLYAISYGTRVALLVMRDFPEIVRAAVLDSTVPPQVDDILDIPANTNRALEVLFAGCADDPGCTAAFPDLAARFDALVAALNGEPVSLPVVDPATGETYTLVLTGDIFVGIMFQLLYFADAIPSLPQLIVAVENGVNLPLLPILAQLFGQLAHSSP